MSSDLLLPRTVIIQRNPKAGARTRRWELFDLVRELKALGYRVRMFRHRDRLAAWMSDPARRQRVCCLVAAGGDGTVSDLLTRYPGIPLAVLPLGTENLLAKFFRLPRSGKKLAAIIHAGHTQTLDIAKAGERRFLICAGIGVDAAIIHDVHDHRRGHITKWNYLGPIWRGLRRRDWPTLHLRDADGTTFEAAHIQFFNLPTYAVGLRWARDAVGDDGRLEVRLFPPGLMWDRILDVWSAWWGIIESRAHIRCMSVTTATITSDVPVPVHVDGDPAGMTPVEITVIPRAMTLFVPAK